MASGRHPGRLPTDHGFDEWWGYRNSADETGWTSYAAFEAIAKAKGIEPPQIWEGTKGGMQTAVRELNIEVRPLCAYALDLPALECLTRDSAQAAKDANAQAPERTRPSSSTLHPVGRFA